MNNKSGRTNLFSQICEYLFVALCIVNFRGMWLHSSDYPLITNRRVIIAISVAALLCIASKGRIKRKKLQKGLLTGILLASYIMLHTVIKHYSFEESLRFAMLAFVMSLYHFTCGDENLGFYKKFRDMMVCISIISLFFWVFGTVLGIIQPSGIIFTTWTSQPISGAVNLKAVRNFYNVYFESQAWGTEDALGIVTNVGIIRNTGMFTETPMYSFLLVLALSVDLFFDNDSNGKWKRMVLLATIITTLSSLGLIMAVFAFSIKLIVTNEKSGVLKILRMMIIPIVLVMGILFVSFLVESKLATSSGITRIDDFAAGMKAWVRSPLFGHGMGNAYSYQQHMSSRRLGNAGLSNSIMQILAYGGIYLLLPYVYCSSRGLKRSIADMDKNRTAFFVLFIIMVIFTICPFQALTIYVFVEMAFHDEYSTVKSHLSSYLS